MKLSIKQLLVVLIAVNTVYIQQVFAEVKMRVEYGTATHGFNKKYEQLQEEFDAIGPFGFQAIRVRNPEGGRPLPLTESTPLDAALSTYFDPLTGFTAIRAREHLGLNEDAPPLATLPIHIHRDAVGQMSLKPHLKSEQMDYSGAWPAEKITHGMWMDAQGTFTVICDTETNENWIEFKVSGLFKNRVYTFWEWWHPQPETVPPQLGEIAILPVAPGGIGTEVISDLDGKAYYLARTNACYPLRKDEPSPSRGTAIAFHWDHMSHGNSPAIPFHAEKPVLPGEGGSIQVWWPTAGNPRPIE